MVDASNDGDRDGDGSRTEADGGSHDPEAEGGRRDSRTDEGDRDPTDGLITVRDALWGLALLWFAAMVAITTFQLVFGVFRGSAISLLVAAVGGGIAVVAGYGSLRRFDLA